MGRGVASDAGEGFKLSFDCNDILLDGAGVEVAVAGVQVDPAAASYDLEVGGFCGNHGPTVTCCFGCIHARARCVVVQGRIHRRRRGGDRESGNGGAQTVELALEGRGLVLRCGQPDLERVRAAGCSQNLGFEQHRSGRGSGELGREVCVVVLK